MNTLAMSFSQILFSKKGRLGRAAFFGYSLLAVVLVFVGVLGGMAMVGVSDSGVVMGFLLLAVFLIAAMWIGLALTIKRLHDMGLSGVHAIWIYGVSFAGGAV